MLHRLALVAGAALALALPASAAAGPTSFAWTETAVTNPHGHVFLAEAIACPTASLCTGAGENLGADYNGYVVDFNPQHPGTPTPVAMSTSAGPVPRLADVSCPTATQCTTVGGSYELTYDPAAPQNPSSGPGYARFVSCPSANQCTAEYVGYSQSSPSPYPPGTYAFATFDPHAPAAHTDTVVTAGTYGNPAAPSGNNVFAEKCPSTTECVVVGTNSTDGVAWTFDPTQGGAAPASTVIDPGLGDSGDNSNAHLSCPTAAECVLIDRAGHEVTFNPASAGGTQPVMLEPNPGYMAAVTCASATQCTALDAHGRALTFDPGTPSTVSLSTLSSTDNVLASIGCASPALCVASEGSGPGHIFVGTSGSPAPVAPVVARPAVKGTAAAVAITCESASGLCAFTLTLSVTAKHKAVSLGGTVRRIAAGRKATVTVHLDKAAVLLLKAKKRLTATLTVTEKGVKPVKKSVVFRAGR